MSTLNSASETQAQPSGIDVNKIREKGHAYLQKYVNTAFENRIAISLKSFLSNTEKIPQEELETEANVVWTDNPHLYPELLRAALQKIGFRGKKLEAEVAKVVEHETQHFAPIAGSAELRPKLGLSFYKTSGLPFSEIKTWKAGVTYDKDKATFSQILDVITNVGELSTDDKEDLKLVLVKIKEELKTRPPEPETEEFIAELEEKYELM